MPEPRDPEGVERRVLHRLIRFAERDVLEIGSGDGRLTWRYAERSASVLGLEPDASQVARARENMPNNLRDRVTFRVADAASVDLPPAAFDVVVLAWSI
jgi:cyclopropane fatty-acyl-phospholipid synthase-like methyltransferase